MSDVRLDVSKARPSVIGWPPSFFTRPGRRIRNERTNRETLGTLGSRRKAELRRNGKADLRMRQRRRRFSFFVLTRTRSLRAA